METLVAQVESAVGEALQASHFARGGVQPLPADPLVFDSGLIDSLGLAELVSALEARTGCSVDMLRFDPLAVETASDLVRELVQAMALSAEA